MVEQKVVAAEDARRNHHVGVHGPERQLQPPRQHCCASARVPGRDSRRRSAGPRQPLREMLRENCRDAGARRIQRRARPRPRPHRAIPAAGNGSGADWHGVIGNNGKEDDHRQPEQISCLDRHVERRIVRNAHGTLHPVHDAARARTRRSAAANTNARMVGIDSASCCGVFGWRHVYLLIIRGRETRRIDGGSTGFIPWIHRQE